MRFKDLQCSNHLTATQYSPSILHHQGFNECHGSTSIGDHGHLGCPPTWLRQMPLLRLLWIFPSITDSHGLDKYHDPISPRVSRLLPPSQPWLGKIPGICPPLANVAHSILHCHGFEESHDSIIRWRPHQPWSPFAIVLMNTMAPSSVGGHGYLGCPLTRLQRMQWFLPSLITMASTNAMDPRTLLRPWTRFTPVASERTEDTPRTLTFDAAVIGVPIRLPWAPLKLPEIWLD